MIEAYSFGSIQVDGKWYSSDIMVGPHEIQSSWWRKSGHSLCMEDLETISGWEFDILVIGTGASGMMAIPEKVRSELEYRGITVEAERTGAAVKRFNNYLSQGKKVAGAFHLTC